jgi:hypothetical protein
MAANNKDQTSTLQSVVDQASAAISGGIGRLTGNPADKVAWPLIFIFYSCVSTPRASQ